MNLGNLGAHFMGKFTYADSDAYEYARAHLHTCTHTLDKNGSL